MKDHVMDRDCVAMKQFLERSASFVPWVPRGVLTSEAYAICVMCVLHGVRSFVESGTSQGRSTEMVARFNPDVPVISIDLKHEPETVNRLGDLCSNAILIMEDSTTYLPSLVDDQEGPVGVFIDGPKGKAAIELAISLMRNAKVAFVGVHDMPNLLNGEMHRARLLLEGASDRTGLNLWFTDDPTFATRTSFLDVNDSNWDDEQGTKWFPYWRLERDKPPVPLGSYGYTIGFLSR